MRIAPRDYPTTGTNLVPCEPQLPARTSHFVYYPCNLHPAATSIKTLVRIFPRTSHLATRNSMHAPRNSRLALAPCTPAATSIKSPVKLFARTSDLVILARTSHPATTIIQSLTKIIARTSDLATRARNSHKAANIIQTLAILIVAGLSPYRKLKPTISN
jgi:hypothetical protein